MEIVGTLSCLVRDFLFVEECEVVRILLHQDVIGDHSAQGVTDDRDLAEEHRVILRELPESFVGLRDHTLPDLLIKVRRHVGKEVGYVVVNESRVSLSLAPVETLANLFSISDRTPVKHGRREFVL